MLVCVRSRIVLEVGLSIPRGYAPAKIFSVCWPETLSRPQIWMGSADGLKSSWSLTRSVSSRHPSKSEGISAGFAPSNHEITDPRENDKGHCQEIVEQTVDQSDEVSVGFGSRSKIVKVLGDHLSVWCRGRGEGNVSQKDDAPHLVNQGVWTFIGTFA